MNILCLIVSTLDIAVKENMTDQIGCCCHMLNLLFAIYLLFFTFFFVSKHSVVRLQHKKTPQSTSESATLVELIVQIQLNI